MDLTPLGVLGGFFKEAGEEQLAECGLAGKGRGC